VTATNFEARLLPVSQIISMSYQPSRKVM